MYKFKPKTTVKRSAASVFASWFRVVLFLVALTGVFLYTRVGQPTRVEAATNSTLNFQARLMTASGGIVADGTYNVEFKLYNASTSSGSSQGSCTGDAACLWTETRTAGNKVTVKNGYLTVNLGSVTAFGGSINWDQQLWLTMNIGGTGAASWDGEMTPRLTLTAVPYALRAGSLATFNSGTGFTSTLSILQPTGGNQTFQIPDQGAAGTYTLLTSNAANLNYIQNQNSADQTADLRISGTARANTSVLTPLLDTATNVALNIGTTNATAINLNQNTTIATGKTLTVTAGATTLTGAVAGNATALTVNSGATTNVGAVIKAIASQTADLFQVQNSSGSVLTRISAAGVIGSTDTSVASTNSANTVLRTGNATGLTSNSGSLTLDVGTATGTTGTISIGTTSASGITIGKSGATTTVNSSQLTNNGSTLNTAFAIADKPSGGNIGTAAATVDIYTTFDVTQTTTSQTLTLPTPTSTTSGRMVYVNNVGSASFTMYGSVIASGKSNAFIWNGSSWITTVSLSGSVVNAIGTINSQPKSADGAVISTSAIYLQTADATYPGLVSTGSQTFAGDKTFNNAVTVAGLLTGQAGATISGATINLNASSNFATNINTGTSTGAVNIGNSAAGAIALQSASTIGLTGTTTITGLSTGVALTVNNSTSTGNILNVQDNGTNVFTISDGGAVLLQNTANSGAAFNVKRLNGDNVLTVDTTNSITTIRGSVTDGVVGSELLVSNAFNNATYWTCGAGWATGASSATHASGGAANACTTTSSNLTVTAGNSYQITFTLTGATFPGYYGVYVEIGGQTVNDFGGSPASINADGTFSYIVTASTTGQLKFTVVQTAFQGTLSAVSVKQVTKSNSILNLADDTGTTAIQIRSDAVAASTFVGTAAGQYNSGSINTGFGAFALGANTTGVLNTAVGGAALGSNTTGGSNSAFGGGFGNFTLGLNTTGTGNSAFGVGALRDNTVGNYNTAIGYGAGVGTTVGSNNTYIGTNTTSYGLLQPSNTTVIGYNAVSARSNSVILGGEGSNAVNVGIGTSNPNNILSVESVYYSTGTIDWSGTTITGYGTTFTPAMVGKRIKHGLGGSATITGYTSATSLTVDSTASLTGLSYIIYNAGLQVSSAGSVGVGTMSPSATTRLTVDNQATTNNILELKDNGTSVLTVADGGGLTMTGNFSQTGSTTFGTGTGAVSLNGNTTISSSNTFTSGTGTVLLQGNTDVAATAAFSTKVGTTFTTPGISNNAALNVASFYLMDTSAAAQVINGITAGRDGQNLTLTNVDAALAVTLTNNSGSATGSKIITGTGGDVTIPIGGTVTLIYDSTNSFWRLNSLGSVSGGFANQQLSNLSGTVAVNLALNPGTDNTLDLGSTANSWRTLYADTSVLTAAVDYIGGGSGTLSIGTTNATTVAVCTTTNCDTINIGTGGDADTIAVGDSTDTTTLSGATVGITGVTTITGNTSINTSGAGTTTIGSASAGAVAIQSASTIGLTANTTVTGLSSGVALTVNNSTSTGNILNIQDNGTNVLTVADGGAVVLQNSTNSTGAFQVRTANGYQNPISVDTTGDAANLIANSSFENVSTGWAYSGTPGSIAQSTAQSYSGTGSLAVTTTANANNGAKYNITLATSSTYQLSFSARLSSGTFTDIIAAYAVDGATESNCTAINTQTINTSRWTRIYCTITTTGTAPSGTPYIVIKQTAGGTARTFYIDNVKLELAATLTPYYGGLVNIDSNVGINTPATSAWALSVQAQNSNNGLLVKSSGTNSIFNQVFAVQDATGTNKLSFNDGTNMTAISGGAAFYNNSALLVTTESGSTRAISLKAAGSQTADLLQTLDSGGIAIARIGGTSALFGSVDQTAASTNSTDTTIRSGNATGGTSNSGNLILDVGTATGTTGTISLGTTSASAISLGRSGITTTNAGALTVAQALLANGDTTIGDATTDRLTVTAQLLGGTPLVFQGATDDAFTTSFAFTNPTGSSKTITFGNETGTVCTTAASAACTAVYASATGNIVQVPTSTAINTITPTAANTVGLTVNATSNATGGVAAIFNQGNNTVTSDTVQINTTNTSGTQTNGLLIARNGAGGTTTNLLNLTNTAGTATNGLTFTGTFGNLINATNFSVANSGNITTNGTYNTNTFTSTALTFAGASPVISASTGNTGLSLQSNGTGTLTLNSTGAGTVNLGTTNTTTIGIGSSASTTTILGATNINNSGTANTTIGNTSNANNTVTIQGGSTGGINIGTAAAAVPITIGNATAGTTFTLESGTGTTSLFNGATAHTVNFATGAAVQTVTIGSTNGASALTLQAGTGTLGIGNDAVAKTTTIAIGANNTGADLVSLGSNNASSTLTLEGGTAASAIQIGNGATAHGIQIGTGAGVNTIVLGSTNTTSSTIIQAGSTGIGLVGTLTGAAGDSILCKDGSNKITTCGGNTLSGYITLQNAYANGNTITSTNARDISFTLADTATDANFITNIATGSTSKFAVQNNGTDVLSATSSTVNIGNNTTNPAVNIDSGTGTIAIGTGAQARTTNIATGAAVQTLTLGSTNSTSLTTIQGGTSGVRIQPANGTTALDVRTSGNVSVLTVDTTNSLTSVRGINSDAVIGSELITSNAFNNATYWTCGAGWTTGASSVTHTVSGGTNTCVTTGTNISVTAGTTYQISFTMAGNTFTTIDGVTVGIGGATYGQPTYLGSNQTHTVVIKATTTGALTFTPTTGFNGTISAVSVKAITSSNAVLKGVDAAGGTSLEVRAAGAGSTLNLFIGADAGKNSTGGLNTGFGQTALMANTTGALNSAFGAGVLGANTTGNQNAAFGGGLTTYTLGLNTTGSYNTALGVYALNINTTGSGNTAVGNLAGSSVTTGSNNTFLGYTSGGIDADNFTTGQLGGISNSTALGYGAIVQASNSLILGGAGSTAVNVGIGTTIPDNTLSVSPTQYSAGTISQTGTAITGSGTTFTSAMVGAKLITSIGVTETITAYIDATHLTAGTSQTITAGTKYRIHYAGLQVTNSGKVGVGTTSPTAQLQVEAQAGGSTTGLIVKGAASQSANLLEFRDSTNTVVGFVDNFGRFNAQSGAANFPSYTFGAASSTGFYTSASNDIGITSNNVSVAEITGSAMYFGNANVSGLNAAPTAYTLQGTSSSTASTTGGALSVKAGGAVGVNNTNGGTLTLAGGQSTGTGTGGGINFQTSGAGSSGSGSNALSTVFSLQGGTGAATFQTTANNANALTVKNAAGDTIINVDTSSAQTGNLITNYSFESNTTGWAAHGTSTITQDATQAYDGTKSMKVAATAVDSGAKYTYALAAATTYKFSFYVKANTGTNIGTYRCPYFCQLDNDIRVRFSPDGTNEYDAERLTSDGNLADSNGWIKMTGIFTTAATSGTRYVSIQTVNTATYTYFIDAVQLESSPNLVTNYGFETNTSGWTAGSGTITQDVSFSDLGSTYGALLTGTDAYATTTVSGLTPYATYTVSTLAGSSNDPVDLSVSPAFSTTVNLYSCVSKQGEYIDTNEIAWIRGGGYSKNPHCTFKANGSGSVTVRVAVQPGHTTAQFDNISVSAGGDTTGAYQNAKISLNGVIDTPLLVRTAQNSSTALQVQNSSGVDIFRVNTANGGTYANSFGANSALTAIQNGGCEEGASLSVVIAGRCSGVYGSGQFAGIIGYSTTGAGGMFIGKAGSVQLGSDTASTGYIIAANGGNLIGSGYGTFSVKSTGETKVRTDNTGSIAAFTVSDSADAAKFSVDTINGRVGINNAVPLYSLDVNGDANISTDATIGSQLAVGSTSSISTGEVISVDETFTNTSGDSIGISNVITHNPGSASTADIYANWNQAVTTDGNTQNSSLLVGARNQVSHQGDGDVLLMYGAYDYSLVSNLNGGGTVTLGVGSYGRFENWGSATVSNASGVFGQSEATGSGNITLNAGLSASTSLSSTGNITSNNGLYVASATDTGAGTIASNYGINVQAQTAGTADYGVAIAAADTQTLWLSSTAGTANAGIGFGDNGSGLADTNLYRSAASTLKTDNSFIAVGNSAIGSGATVDGTGPVNSYLQDAIGVGTYASTLSIQDTFTGSAATFNNGQTIKAVANFSGAATSFIGSEVTAATASGNAQNVTIMAGGYNALIHRGTGTISAAYGVATSLSNKSSGTISDARALYGVVENTSTGIITTAYGLKVGTAVNSGGGSIGTNYGLMVDPQTVGTADYGVAIGATDTTSGNVTLWVSHNTDSTDKSGGITFGQSKDTNLYRSAANTLKTDSNIVIGGTTQTFSGASGTITTSTAGANLTMSTAAGSGAGAGGLVTLQAGAGGATGAGGGVTIATGQGGSTSGTNGTVTIQGTGTLASVAGNGTAASNVLTVTSITGGATSGTTGQTAGVGSGISETLGTGGAATGASGANIGGAGGTYLIQGGTGGAAASTTAAARGGAGSAVTINTGTGGAATGASGAVVGGAGGTYTLQGGAGGAITASATAGATGGAGANISIITGVGGAVSTGGAAATVGGAGGTLTLQASAGGNVTSTGGASGQGGAINITAGAAGTGGTTAKNGGAITITSGAGNLAGVGGALTLQGGQGGATGAGAGVNIQGGAGGATSGNGGTINIIGGTTTSGTGGAVNILAGYVGNTSAAVNIGSAGTSTKASTINIANTSDGTSTQTVSIGSNANTANAVTLSAGATGYVNLNTGQTQFTEVTGTRTFTVQTRTSNIAGSGLTVAAGTAGAGATGVAGGTLTLQGGGAAGTTGAANGGDVTITGGAAVNAGYQGLVNLSSTAFSTAPVQTISSSGIQAITAGNQNIYSTLPITASVSGVIATLGDPGQSVIGRILYVTARSGSNDFTLRLNSSRTPIDITMKANSTATLIWNGTDWTAAGASSSTDLQAAYNNTVSSAGGAELILNAPGGNADGLTIRNNVTTPISGGLLEVQTSIGGNLFSVNNNATEYASNGGAETSGTSTCTSGFPASTWTTAPAGGTCSRSTTAGTFTTGQASAAVTTTGTQYHGLANQLSTTLTAGLRYTVSFAVKGSANFTSLEAVYSANGTATAGQVRSCFAGIATLTGTGGTQTTTTITGSNFTAAMVGSVIVFANGQSAYITGFTNSTTLTTSAAYSQTVTSQNYAIYSNAITTNQSTWTRVTCDFIAPSGATSSNAIFIRQNDSTARTFYVDNLSVTVNASVNHAADGSVDSAALAPNWVAVGGSVAIDNSNIYDTSGAVSVTTGAINRGVYNFLGTNGIIPTVSATGVQYRASFYVKANSGSVTLTNASVYYSPDSGTTVRNCNDLNVSTVTTTDGYKLVSCIFTTNNTAASGARFYITNTSNTSFYVDALTITLNTNTANNVQIGGANNGGPVTLFTLDRSAGAPIAANNDAYLGSMYFDTSTNSIQCYGTSGWGACGAAPDNIVNLNPEYAGAVLNGTGVGTMTADFCANQASVLVVPATGNICASGEARNFYKWTSPQATQQTYSIYVTYQLPSTFKSFASDNTVQLTGRVSDTANSAVTYEMFKNQSGVITACGTETTVTTSNNTWQTVGINGNETTGTGGCSFNTTSAGSFVIFKINLKANSGANAYASTLSFTTKGQ